MRTKSVLFFLVAILVFIGNSLKAQVLDGIYVKETTPARKVISYTHLREADVFWTKRIWQLIDLREKMNQVFYYPEEETQGRSNLFDVIKKAIVQDGTLTAYDPGLTQDDQFQTPMTPEEVKSLLIRIDTVMVENLETGEPEPQITETETKGIDIKKYRLKEEWFFDKQRSVMEARIIGIAPIKDEYTAGVYKGEKILFWIYFPEARFVFANAEVFNRQNDSERRTYEDIFWKRQFTSVIIKESNTYDRLISEYKSGLDALLEAESIKQKVFNFEHDLWSF